jgi:hypothetical protein
VSVRTTGVEGKVALFDSTSGLAFGPVFDSDTDAEEFLEHLRAIGERDPRVIPAVDLARVHREWEDER